MDTSAVVTLLTGSDYATELVRFLASQDDSPLVMSSIGFVETVRVADRLGAFPMLLSELVQAYGELVVSDEIRDSAALLIGGLKTPDAIHVASALSLGEDLTFLVSYDKRMLEVATEQGIPVASPGLNA
ncbi:type II toxin-antitoxin system VapC family toxin [Actinorhabdospora filicis]|nr:type II toxin-antitoxin system VapC family toxin [Actinorhabdospora filicis]